MSILIQGSQKTSALSTSSLSWSQTCGGSDRALVVAVQWRYTGVVITSVTYAGRAMEAQSISTSPGTEATQFFLLRDPDSGSNTVVVTFADVVNWCAAESISLSQTRQTGINRLVFVQNSSGGGAPTVSVSDSVSGDVVIDAPISQTTAITAAGGQTAQQQFDDIQATGFSSGLSTKTATGASTTLSWTGGTTWAETAVSMVPASDSPVVIQPPAGALVFKGPQSATSVDRWMAASGVMAIAGYAAAVLLSIGVPAGAVTLTGQTPTVALGPSVVSDMGAGALVWHGLTPTVLVEFPGIAVGAGSLVWGGFIPNPVIITKTIEVPAGSLVFKGPARPQEVPQPTAGSLVLTGYTVQATVGGGGTSPQINVGVGVLTWHGLTPAAFPDRSILVGAGSLVLSGQYIGVEFSPLQAGSMVWQGLIPTVQGTSTVVLTPGVGSLVLHGEVPTSHLDQGPNMPAGSLVLHGLAPLSGQTVTVTPGAGSLVFTGLAPNSQPDVVIPMGVGHLAYGAQQVAVFLTTVYYPDAGILTFVGYVAQPTVTVFDPQTANPADGVLRFSSQAPTVTATTTTDIAVDVGSIVLAGQAPIYLINNAPQMPAGSLVFSGQVPERSQVTEIPVGRLIWQGWLVRSVNSGDASPIPPLAYGSGMFFYQSQRR